ncbi:MAG: HIRAN domain-containing protein [Acidiferrobacter sp.]
MHLIEHTFNPARLLLVWQAPKGGSLFVVGELRDRGGVVVFQYLRGTNDLKEALVEGFSYYPAFPKPESEYTEGVMDAFMHRLPPRSRADYSKYLEQWRLPADAELSDFALLGYAGAKLPSDGFSVVWPLDEVTAPGEILLEVAGFRYQNVKLDELAIGMPVTFVSEPENDKDPKAVRMEVEGKRIGYAKRAQREAVGNWLTNYDVDARLERFNGTAERPVVYIFCRLSEQRPRPLA